MSFGPADLPPSGTSPPLLDYVVCHSNTRPKHSVCIVHRFVWGSAANLPPAGPHEGAQMWDVSRGVMRGEGGVGSPQGHRCHVEARLDSEIARASWP